MTSSTKRLTCGDSGCRMPGATSRYGGQHTNGGCRCRAEDIADAHEEIAAELRNSPKAARELRMERQEHEHMSKILHQLITWTQTAGSTNPAEAAAKQLVYKMITGYDLPK